MALSATTPRLLAERIIAHLGKKPDYPPVPTEGAEKAAEFITQLL